MSEGVKKVFIIAGVVCAVVIGGFALTYDAGCDNELFKMFHSSCFGPK